MERRNFIKASAIVAAASATSTAMASQSNAPASKEIYEWRVYHFKSGAGKSKIDGFYKDALIPFMTKKGVKVGAFGEYGLTEPPVIYFLLVYPSISEYYKLSRPLCREYRVIRPAHRSRSCAGRLLLL